MNIYDEIKKGIPLSTRLLKEIHTILMTEARGTRSNGGEFRKIQNFIGPDNNIENASYIPVSANRIPEYMTNLEYFINGLPHQSFDHENEIGYEAVTYDSDSLLRIAVSHAQFESIHPFLDGNGRLGRILITLMAVQEKVISLPVFFVSEELEKERIRYYNSLNATRGDNPNWALWLNFFLDASERMADNLIKKVENAEEVMKEGLKYCKTRSQKDAWIATFQLPIITVNELKVELGVHYNTAQSALNHLVSNNLLDKDQSVKRNIKYYNYELLRAISN
ncbi:Fic family protein [Aerococcus suis]